MKPLLTIALLFVLASCGQTNQSNRSALLTSSIWTIERESIDDFPRMADQYTFLANGTCVFVAGDTDVYGNWAWAGDDEIRITPKELVHDGHRIKIEHSYGVDIRIVELTNNKFRAFEKGEADSWTSGLLKERKYTALNL